MAKYRIVLDFRDEARCANLETISEDILIASATVSHLKFAMETPDREKQQPDIRIYVDEHEVSVFDFQREYEKILMSSPEFGSALPKGYKHK